MLASPLASTAGWTWSQDAIADLPRELAGAFPSTAGTLPAPGVRRPDVKPEAVIGAGPPTALSIPFTGRVRHAASGSTHWIWGRAADLARYPDLLTRLPFGNPLIALRFTDATMAEPDAFPGEGLKLGDPLVLAGGVPILAQDLAVVAVFPRQPGLDTLAVLRALRTALNDAATPDAASWAAFVGAFDGLEAPLRLLEPGGRPVSGRQVTVERPGGPTSAVLQSSHRGNVLAATGLTRAGLGAGSRLIIPAAGEELALATAAGKAEPAGLDLSGQPAHLDIAALNDWFGPQGSAALRRFSRGNRVTPYVNGPAFFNELFRELHAYTPGAATPPAFYLAGFAIDHAANFVPESSGLPHRSLETFARQFAQDGGEARFLALQFLQLTPGFVETAENGALIAALILAIAGGLLTFAQDSASWDQVNFWGHTQALAVGLFFAAGKITDLLDTMEPNKAAIEALSAIPGVLAALDPYPAECGDNPICQPANEIIALAQEGQRRFNVFHQKLAVVRNDAGLHAYCGGIDINPNRLDDRDHGVPGPYHDVHARVDGFAAGELARTFIERWDRPAAPGDPPRPVRAPLALAEPGALDGLPDDGPDIVQVARTYFGPDPFDSGRALPFAPNGERTILDTTLQAIAQARRYIYIEDQYLTPSEEFTAALEAAASQVSGPLIILIPSVPDQPFGFAPRQAFVNRVSEAWGDRFKIGSLRQHFYRSQTNRTKAIGRMWLTADAGEGDNTIKIGPPDRLPDGPFWVTLGTEAMYVRNAVPESRTETEVELRVDRADATNLFDNAKGTKRSAHKKGAAVCCGIFPGIYVHTKMMLVDDAFAAIGSANLNRRGFFSDGECHLFALREALGHGDDNWIRALRKTLWSEVCGVPEAYGDVAFDDPVANLKLFDRRFVTGGRFVPYKAQPFQTEMEVQAAFNASTSKFGGIGFIAGVGRALLEAAVGTQVDAIFDSVIDPSSKVVT
ncbi:hypothetical protein [uncultured Phenylobacterium sp.]|uniref:hypothetical protein n=1 Tax=uncultured Phenylobacterium sp. TaxID=349273 RepID=UPI0025F96B79|nr:hypothetical protein [uncultured Phenylobacterium sp.]